jgi:hypothetical protein
VHHNDDGTNYPVHVIEKIAATTVKMNKKILIVIGVLLSIVLLQSHAGAQISWTIKRVGYSLLATYYGSEGWGVLESNIVDIILLNPPVDELYNLMGIVMKIVFAFYIPAIVFLGSYLLLLSNSPAGRAKAKAMLSKLIIGFIMVSVSPQLIKLLLEISEKLTSSILAFTATDIFSGALSGVIGGKLVNPPGLSGLHLFSTFVSIELGFYVFLFFMVLVWGSFIFPIVIRFFAVSTFIVLFPLSIFL